MKPRGNCNGTLKLVSTILECKARAKFARSCFCFTYALQLMKFDEVNLRFLRSPGLAIKIVFKNSSNPFASSHDHELFEMKQTAICHEYGLKSNPAFCRILHSHAFSRRFCLALLFRKKFLEY